MREIIFRGKRIDNGEWIYGDLIQDGKGYVGMWEQTPLSHNYKIDPSTVGQYTGLTDKNGKKIFEGDIIFTTEPIGMGYREICGKVVYKAPKFYADCKNFIMLLDFDYGKADYTVIGNVYDNPELMEA